jgi:hypothetical protein
MRVLMAIWMLGVMIQASLAQDTGLPQDKVALRYRIEYLDKDKWKPVEDSKKFKKNNTIRFRFMSNVAGALYVLNTSEERTSLQPVFAQGQGGDLRRSLGMGAHIEANHVGVFPTPEKGGGLRFTGVKGEERFLFVYVPDDLGGRDVMATPAGAEGWHFEDKSTYMVTGDWGHMLFHYFELRSK